MDRGFVIALKLELYVVSRPSLVGFNRNNSITKGLPMPAIIRVFDPAMCCSTGVCGPGIDPEHARFAADVDWLQKQGVTVERFNLSQQPGAFVAIPSVVEALARGNHVLPLVLVGDHIAVEGAYPSRETLAALAGIVVKKLQMAPAAASSGCGPGGAKPGCC
jgi:hypothetical protein